MKLTRFEMNPRRRDTMRALASPEIMHASIMYGFPSIGRSPEERILWRIDNIGSATFLLIQSEGTPDLTHMVEQYGWPASDVGWETLNYEPFLSEIKDGQSWRFRLAANPTHSVMEENGGKRGKIYPEIGVKNQQKWLLSRAEKLGFEIPPLPNSESIPSLFVKESSVKRFNKGRKDSKNKRKTLTVNYAVYEGVLNVIDSDLLVDSMRKGIGRSKAYGCGLLTLAK